MEVIEDNLHAALHANRKLDSVIFNNITYSCRWAHTTDRDGQRKEIILSFCRRQSRGSWPTEHYVRVSKDLYILQYRCPSDSQRHQESFDGIFYDVAFKLLRCLSCSKGTSSHLPAPISHWLYDLGWISVQHSVDLIYGHYSQPDYEVPGEIPVVVPFQDVIELPASLSPDPSEPCDQGSE